MRRASFDSHAHNEIVELRLTLTIAATKEETPRLDLLDAHSCVTEPCMRHAVVLPGIPDPERTRALPLPTDLDFNLARRRVVPKGEVSRFDSVDVKLTAAYLQP